MKIFVIILGLLFFLVIGGIIWIVKGESGGTDNPLSKDAAEYTCQRWLPQFADSIYCKWWTGGTQEWVHQVRFHYPENMEGACFDTLLSDHLATWRKGIRVQNERRIELAEKLGPGKPWWVVGKDPNLVHLGPDTVKDYGDYVWIDTVKNTVFWISRQ